jgi:putative phosphoribosyl transferase
VERAAHIEQPVGAILHGDLALPAGAAAVVVFAHGSGSSRHSPRNQTVARSLQRRGLGTLLMDLLTEAEEAIDAGTRRLRFDIELLADRLAAAARWLDRDDGTAGLPLGYFGASTGAAAALVAAARHPRGVAAVVSRGGRPDLAGSWLAAVRAPTLLIVGALDTEVIELNRIAFNQMDVERSIEVIAGASHLFEEPGTLEEVSRLAGDWFTRHLPRGEGDAPGPA